MRSLASAVSDYCRGLWQAWDAWLFAPTDPATLCLIRVLAGSMLLYTHVIWSKDLGAFFGPDGFLPADLMDASRDMRFFPEDVRVGVEPDNPRMLFSYFPWLGGGWLMWLVHVLSLVVFFCLTIGLFSRTMAVLAFVATVSYVARVTPGAYFGLDKVNCMLAMYLMLGPCGARYSVDRLFAMRRGRTEDPPPSQSAGLALRMIQLHMCVIYLFSGLGKLQGDMWWNGSATWFAVASTEYRSLDMTWLAYYLPLADFLTHSTVFLELFYCCLVWNRWCRPVVVASAIGMHVFIAGAMGMITFGVAMIYGNLAFVPASWVRAVCDPIARRFQLALVGERLEEG